jgi:methylase of polypeptide subunit release factors
MTTRDSSSISARIAGAISRVAAASKDEKELRQRVHPLFEGYLREHGSDLSLHVRQERVLANGRSDAVFNRLILEYKRPNSFTSKRKVADALTQLRIYIEDLVKEERWTKQRLLGVAFDGGHFVYLKFLGRWIPGKPIPVSPQSVEEFLRYLVKLTDKAALIPENLIRDFAIGEESKNDLAVNAIQSFYKALLADHSPRTRALFEQWQEQFSDVHGAFDEKRRFDRETLRRSYGFGKLDEVQLLPFFFSLETFFSLLMKLLAYQVVGYYLNRKIGLPLAEWDTHPSERFREELTKLDEGEIFSRMGIRNFIEGDFFGWYLSDWNDSIEQAVRELVRRLNQYDPETIEVEPEYTRDLLKQLYQYLIPPQIRHDLGEYYTPDWLAERVLNQLNYGEKDKDLLDKRLLDPGCGSGTFLILAIKRALAHARQKGIKDAVTLRKITSNIHGFDLNPLAVMAARTNYLMALSELLPVKNEAFRDRGGELTIPVYLCDSIKPPEAKVVDPGTLLETKKPYEFKTAVGMFRFAEPMVTKQRLQRLTPLFEDCVKRRFPEERFLKRVREELDFTEDEWVLSEPYLKETFARLSDLDAKGINGIWANILKNAFAPLFVGTFDLIAGNPPWVNWEALPQHYRDATQHLWVDYGLFSLKGQAARLGGGKKDLSMLFTYVSIDKYLRDNGCLGFVITQTLFKTMGAGDGFRRFRLGQNGTPFNLEVVDDMVDLQPFEAATNRTAVFSARKGGQVSYPVQYWLWRKKTGGNIDSRLTWKEVFDATKRFDLRACPVGESETSPWMAARPRALDAIRKVLGKSAYKAWAGACTWLNGIYWVRIRGKKKGLIHVENLHEIGKIKVPLLEVDIEPELVYPLLRGREIERWQAAPQVFFLVPQDSEKRTGYDEVWMTKHLPETYKYLEAFKGPLMKRSGYVKYLNGEPFYSIYNVGPYTFAPYKVVWKEQSSEFQCAVVSTQDGKSIVPDHKVMLVPFESASEANYVCAMLNSTISRFIVAAYAIATSQSTHILENIAIPKFEPDKALHRDLSRLSEQCHEKTMAGVPIQDLEEQIDALAAELWGMIDEEMTAIRESIAILSPPRKKRRKEGAVKAIPEEADEENEDDA